MEQIDQFPCGITIKIAPWDNMQVTVAFLNFDLKIGAHAYTSDSYLIAFRFFAYYAFGEIPDFAINPAIKYNNIFYNKPTAGMLLFGQDSCLNNCRVNN
jgi:hypothetical protein